MPEFSPFLRGICAGATAVLALATCSLGSAAIPSVPVPLIIDTATATDCDDAGALAVAHALQNRAGCVILGVVVNNKDSSSVGAVDAVNTWYGRGDIPLGAYETINNGINGRDSWDLCAVLHAVRGLANYRTAVTVGSNAISTDGTNAWVASTAKNQAHSVASMPKPQLAAILADLMDAPPLPRTSHSPVKVIFDTDFSTDCDDAGALAVLHALTDNGEAEILATGASTRLAKAPGAIDVINTYYGRPDLPIGATKVGPTFASSYVDYLFDNFPHDTPLSASVMDAVATYRQALAAQPDDSVVFITVGYLTNIAELLKSPADAYSPLTGQQLVAAKVREWACMGGNFWTKSTDNVNFSRDTASAQYAIANFPKKLTFVPREVASVPSPLRAGEELNETPLTNPVRIAYHKYFHRTTGINQHCADLATVLYAVRGARDYWDLHSTGSMTTVNADGTFTWNESVEKDHNYLVMKGGNGVYSNKTYVEGVLRNLLKQTPAVVVDAARARAGR